MTIKIDKVDDNSQPWFVEVAAVRMLEEELKRPDLVNKQQLYNLSNIAISMETAFVAKDDGKLVGAIAGILVPNTYNPSITTLVELFWWVDPNYRNGRAGLMLLNEYIKTADNKADECTLSLLTSSKLKSETVEKKGFKLSEFAYTRRSV